MELNCKQKKAIGRYIKKNAYANEAGDVFFVKVPKNSDINNMLDCWLKLVNLDTHSGFPVLKINYGNLLGILVSSKQQEQDYVVYKFLFDACCSANCFDNIEIKNRYQEITTPDKKAILRNRLRKSLRSLGIKTKDFEAEVRTKLTSKHGYFLENKNGI